MSKLRRSITAGLLIAAVGSFVSLNAQAEEGCSHGPAPFTDFDKDGSGKGHCGGSGKGMGMKGKMPTFADFDLNGDGKIVEQEFNEAHAARMSEMAAEGRQMKNAEDFPGFAGIDTDADGVISEVEFAKHQAEHHPKMQELKEPLASTEG